MANATLRDSVLTTDRVDTRASEFPGVRESTAVPDEAGSAATLRAQVTGVAGRLLWSYGAILLFLLVWQLASQFRVIDRSVIPPFTEVVAALVRGFINGALVPDLEISMARAGIAFGIAVAVVGNFVTYPSTLAVAARALAASTQDGSAERG